MSTLKPAQYLIVDSSQMPKQYDDEIDLLDLMKTLWSARYKLMAYTGLVVIITALIVLWVQPTYQSKATLTTPSISDISHLLPNPLKGFDVTQEKVFDHFSTLAKSQVLKKIFFDQFIAKNQKMDEVPRFIDFAKKLDAKTVLDKTDNVKTLDLAFESHHPLKTPVLLDNYIKLVNQKTLDDYASDFVAYKASVLMQLQSKVSQLRGEQKDLLAATIVKYEDALTMAKSLKVKKPSLALSSLAGTSNTDTSNTDSSNLSSTSGVLSTQPLYMFGTDYLSMKLKQLKAKPNVDANIPELPALLAKIESIKTNKMYTEKGMTFQYLAEPLSPAEKIKPKRALILVLAAVLGFFMSLVVVLIQSKFKEATTKQNKS